MPSPCVLALCPWGAAAFARFDRGLLVASVTFRDEDLVVRRRVLVFGADISERASGRASMFPVSAVTFRFLGISLSFPHL